MARWKPLKRLSTAVVAVALLVAATSTGATEQQKQSRGVTNIVLVHGAWADGSSWSKVIHVHRNNAHEPVGITT